MWYLIIFFVAAAGSSPGGDIEKVEFNTRSACIAAKTAVYELDTEGEPWRHSKIGAVCVPKG